MRKIQTKLDINKQNYLKLDCMQNDDINLQVLMLENGLSYSLAGKTISINWVKGDNTFVMISGSTAITITNNLITINLLRDCTRAVGESRFELVIKDNASKQVSTFPFSIDVVGSVLATSGASKNVVTVIEELDKTLGEAKVVIDKINTKGNGIYTVPSTEWAGSEPNLTYRLNHGMMSKSLIVSIVDTNTQESMPNNFRYIDMNNIELRSTTKTDITIAINANYYSGKDANTVSQEIIDARKGKSNLKTKIDEIDTSISGINTSINEKQAKTDNTLTTTSKTVVGAINENKTNITATSNKVGNTQSAKTNAKDNLVNMVNELYDSKASTVNLVTTSGTVDLDNNIIIQADSGAGNTPIFSLNKTFDGLVTLNASFQHKSKTDAITNTYILCILPVGFRPKVQLMFPCVIVRNTYPDVQSQMVSVYPDGRVMAVIRPHAPDVVTPLPCEVVRVSFFF